jgi:hypothetical protein
MKDFFKKNGKFLSLYSLWVLVHTYLLITSDGNRTNFWPFTGSDLYHYNISAWVVYVFAPLVIVFIYKSFNQPKHEN